jgi:hypothetical protein
MRSGSARKSKSPARPGRSIVAKTSHPREIVVEEDVTGLSVLPSPMPEGAHVRSYSEIGFSSDL